MSRQQVRHRLTVFLGQVVAEISVQLTIEGPQFAVELVHQLDHFGGSQAVVADLVLKVIAIAQALHGGVAQAHQVAQARF